MMDLDSAFYQTARRGLRCNRAAMIARCLTTIKNGPGGAGLTGAVLSFASRLGREIIRFARGWKDVNADQCVSTGLAVEPGRRDLLPAKADAAGEGRRGVEGFSGGLTLGPRMKWSLRDPPRYSHWSIA